MLCVRIVGICLVYETEMDPTHEVLLSCARHMRAALAWGSC